MSALGIVNILILFSPSAGCVILHTMAVSPWLFTCISQMANDVEHIFISCNLLNLFGEISV